MNNLYEKIDVKITPLTPIHIGNGENLQPYEYVVKDGYLYVIHLMDIYENLKEKEQKEFIRFLEKDLIQLRTYINHIYKEELGYKSKIEVSFTFEQLYNTKIGYVDKKNEQNELLVANFSNSHGNKFLPGSALKGAMRGSLAYTLGKEAQIFDYSIIKSKRGIDRNKLKSGDTAKNKYKEYDNKIFSKTSPYDDPFKSIKVMDSYITEDENFKICDINVYSYKKSIKAFKKGVPTQNLCTKSLLESGYIFSFNSRLSIFDGFFEKNHIKIKIDLNNIIKSLNLKSKDMINNELDFFNKTQYIETYNIYKKLETIYENLESNEALIRLGKGTGFDNLTFNLSNQSRDNSTDSISRSLALNKYPLGWAVIQFD